jgi:hypothetical protein
VVDEEEALGGGAVVEGTGPRCADHLHREATLDPAMVIDPFSRHPARSHDGRRAQGRSAATTSASLAAAALGGDVLGVLMANTVHM